jgi:hypothetical protein
MKTWTQTIKHGFDQKHERGWKTLYWCIDLHDTVITGTYDRFNLGSKLFPYAKETLDYLYNSDEHVSILWTSSHIDAVKDITKKFDLKFNHFNCNPECPNTNLCDFDKKFYFNFLLDDKSGFDPLNDWKEIYDVLTSKNQSMTNKQKRIIEDRT